MLYLENNVDSLSKEDHHKWVKGTQFTPVLMKFLCGNRINRMDTDIMIKKFKFWMHGTLSIENIPDNAIV